MKLYYHPVSITCRPIILLAEDEGIGIDYISVDLFTEQHLQPAFSAINPNQQVPVLEDGNFRLTESSAILKYLADKTDSPAYPPEMRPRAKVNEIMDWCNTGLLRDLGYGLIYPQIFPNHKRAEIEIQKANLDWSRPRARRWLGILDKEIIGKSKYVCGNEISIADYFCISIVTIGEVAHLNYAPWPNLTRWIGTMKARPSWNKVNDGFYTYLVAPNRNASFEGL